MRTRQHTWQPVGGFSPPLAAEPQRAQWVLVFGSAAALENRGTREAISRTYPEAIVTGCTTAGEIAGGRIHEGTLVLTAIEFEHTAVRAADVDVTTAAESFAAGQSLSQALLGEGLAHVFVLSDGLGVNGTQLARGLRSVLPEQVAVTGGLAADGARFERTLVLLGEDARPGRVVAVGLYGAQLRVGFGSMGGWDPYGPDRTVTRAEGNVLYELDGEPALDLYVRYLGEAAARLPASGLLFPLRITLPDSGREVVRTILGVDPVAHSLTFAGDIPVGATARLMKANFDRLIDGAGAAASHSALAEETIDLAILISCVGRRLVLQQRTEEEIESVQEVCGSGAVYTGFYSYGELCPVLSEVGCELHNQTMTITTFHEAD
jgi:hypothetical protein